MQGESLAWPDSPQWADGLAKSEGYGGYSLVHPAPNTAGFMPDDALVCYAARKFASGTDFDGGSETSP